jgi:hypothetical protein
MTRHAARWALPAAIAWILLVPPSPAAAPTLYSTPDHESPVRADPDDLLLLAGFGFSNGDKVVYRAVDDTTQRLVPPPLPAISTPKLGLADVVSVADAPYSLAVHLPASLTQDQSYALWVVNSSGETSNVVLTNDARPLWITPDEVYANAPSALPRRIKVVGRNLQPVTGKVTQVRLAGRGGSFVLPAVPRNAPASTVERYVAEVELPASVKPGRYRVSVSRDGVSWVPLGAAGSPDSVLTVLPDPRPAAQFAVGDYRFANCTPDELSCRPVRGNCRPDAGDGDQTVCITAAIAAAHAAGGGSVTFARGAFTMTDPGAQLPGKLLTSKGVSLDGVLVPDGVSLQGAGREFTTILRGPKWNLDMPSFALQGHNTVAGFKFGDARQYGPKDYAAPMLSLGVRWDRAKFYGVAGSAAPSHMAIAKNLFDRPFIAIGSGGLPLDHIVVVDNVFGAYRAALVWEGTNTAFPYHFSDSVISHNTFYPGSYLDVAIGQGTVATGLSGGSRIDFSDNVADGTSSAFLYNPEQDAKGWRAAFFWAMHDDVELMLVSRNTVTCSGDKDGDGEAIAYDNNHNRPGFAGLTEPVISSSSDSTGGSKVTLRGSLIESHDFYGKVVDVRPTARYYVGDWLQIVQGPGIGQARKIAAISAGADSQGSTVTFTVYPRLDVLPDPGSLATVGRMFWQTLTIDNFIDHRQPTCLKSNRTRRAGGLITLYAQTTDSVVEGNRQFDTSGILLVHQFQSVDPGAGIRSAGAMVQSFNEIRGNLVSGTYDANDRTAQAEYGIAAGFGATPHTKPPPTISYGLAISHNTVERGGGSKGAISFNQGWYTGPPSSVLAGITPWKIADATLVFKNTFTDLGGSGSSAVGIGISAGNRTTPIEWRTVIYGNVCQGIPPREPLVDLGTQTVRYCPAVTPQSCDCLNAPAQLELSTEKSSVRAVGGRIEFPVSVASTGENTTTDSVLAVEASTGVSIDSLQGAGATCDTADGGALHCLLGDIAPGKTVTLFVKASATGPGSAWVHFSATHREADPYPARGGLKVTIEGDNRE